jgi:hypothetical protein
MKKLWRIFGGKIVTIGKPVGTSSGVYSGRFFRFLQCLFAVWGKRNVQSPEIGPMWRKNAVTEGGIQVP